MDCWRPSPGTSRTRALRSIHTLDIGSGSSCGRPQIFFAAPVEIGSLSDVAGDDGRTELLQLIADPYSETPEQIMIRAETIEDVQTGLREITARERTYLLYRYGFADGDEHPIPETAAHSI